MGHSQADKADSRERILKQAAEQIRDAGLESLSVGPLMRSVNLTHGGFYGHFASRSELLAQALERALQDGAAASMAAIGATPDYPKLLRSYLSRKHRDMRRNGCAIAALASDVARADEASREVMNWLKAHYMQDHIGDEFDGIVSGVTSFGLFVTLDGLAIDGLVHITELGRDYFHFDAARHTLIGERSGRTFQLAGRIRVKVARVDLEQAKIDFTLADEQPVDAPKPRPVFAEPLSREDRPRKGKAQR